MTDLDDNVDDHVVCALAVQRKSDVDGDYEIVRIPTAPVHTTTPTTPRSKTYSLSQSRQKHDSSHQLSQWTPTLRRVSLLNTLLFLGLALSRADISTHGGITAATIATDDKSQTSHVDVKSQSQQQEPHSKPTAMPLEWKNTPSEDFHDVDATNSDLSISSITDWKMDEDAMESDLKFDRNNDEDLEFMEASSEGEESFTKSRNNEVFIVATVDGTLAAVETSTGKILWKQEGKGSGSHHQTNARHQNHDDGLKIARDNPNRKGDKEFQRNKLLQPLIATTTTAASARNSDSSSLTAAIPSIDGSVFLTTADYSTSDSRTSRATGTSLTKTDIASLQELVARAPYVDNNGLFYVGSRHTTAAAVDAETGDILFVADNTEGSVDGSSNSNKNTDPQWEGRNVVWIGRVDYSVSVYNAKSSIKEVQFSAAEIMSVNDMVQGKGKSERMSRLPIHNPTATLTGATMLERAPHLLPSGEFSFQDSTYLHENDEEEGEGQLFSQLVATPSGNLAFRNPTTGKVEWVADQTFETPIAYALHSSSGQSLAVDIIPDVTMPSQSREYLTREIDRQIELTLNNDIEPSQAHDLQQNPPIVGILSNGQLYSMPLGKRRASSNFSPQSSSRSQKSNSKVDRPAVHHHHTAASTSSVASLNDNHVISMKMPLAIGRLPHQQEQYGPWDQVCGPSSPSFPSCLFKVAPRRNIDPKERTDWDHSNHGLKEMESGAVEAFQHPLDYESISYQQSHDRNSNYNQQRPRNYRKILRILGSWLPPTIALIFVVSFEMGRRKRQKDRDELKLLSEYKSVEGNELLTSVSQKDGVAEDAIGRQVIQITDQVLGYGGHGTVVFRGTLEGRNVAVKRMLKTYLASADREISLLIESDGHPNVVRYFLKEVKGDFVYLALELCDLSLHNLIGTLVSIFKDSGIVPIPPKQHCISNATKKLLLQIATGVRHLHRSRIVHNDLKPANILLALSKEVKNSDSGNSNEFIYDNFEHERYLAKISDMGLGKMLAGQSSFGGSTLAADGSLRPISNNANSNGNVGIGPGTVGWMAPEAMRMKPSTPTAAEASHSGESSPLDKPMGGTRASRSVDIFSLGCIFYSTLVPGSHPFGEWYEREANIMRNRPFIETLQSLSMEAYDLVNAMIQHNPRIRPTAKDICEHPYFWNCHKRLSFMCDLSDRLETESGGLDGVTVSDNSPFSSNPLAIERNASRIVGLAWDKFLYKGLTEQRYRTYDPSSVRDLLRLLRNKKNHFQDLDASVRQKIGSDTDGLMEYFESCFPELLMHCYHICCELLPPDDPLATKYSLIAFIKDKAKEAAGKFAPEEPVGSGDVKKLPLVVEEPHSGSRIPTSHSEEKEHTVVEEMNNLDTQDAGVVEHKNHRDVPLLNTDGDAPYHDQREQQKEQNQKEFIPGKVAESSFPIAKEIGLDSGPYEEANTVYAPPIAPSISDGNVQASGIVLWEGSTASKTLNCRGWIRSDDEWTSRSTGGKKLNATLMRCAEDPKFRTRLCNHWDTTLGTFCPMRKKNKCVFAHGPVELRVKEGKRNRWGKLVDKNGNNSNPKNSGGEDTYGAARSIESVRKEEGKWNTSKGQNGGKKAGPSNKKKSKGPSK